MKSLLIRSLLIFIFPFSGQDEYEYIKIYNLSRKPIIEARLNGKKAYFLLDTGSNITLLNISENKRYNFMLLLRRHEKRAAVGIGGKTIDIVPTKNIRLVLGSRRVKTRFLATDISVITKNIYRDSRIKISGLIGSDVMKKYGVIIDYEREVVGIRVS